MAIVQVSRETHAKKRFKPATSFSFARSMLLVRIIASEAPLIAQNFPIGFISENETVAPVAVLGLAKDENLFVSDQGQWLGLYVPALLRRYPFYMGKAPAQGTEKNNLAILIDDQFLSDTEGEPLFGPDEGEPKGPLSRAIQLLTEIAIQDARTVAMVKGFEDNGLLDPLPLQVTRGTDAPVNLTGLRVVNESKLNALPDDRFLELRRNGSLALAYAHLISLGQFGRLRALASAKLANAPARAI